MSDTQVMLAILAAITCAVVGYFVLLWYSKVRKMHTLRVLLIVLTVILFGMFVRFQFRHFITPDKSKVGAAMGDIVAFNTALQQYRTDIIYNRYPESTLVQLYKDNAPGWAGPYMATITTDPWNNNYTYTSDGTTYTILSVHVASTHKSETIRYVCTGNDTGGMVELIP